MCASPMIVAPGGWVYRFLTSRLLRTHRLGRYSGHMRRLLLLLAIALALAVPAALLAADGAGIPGLSNGVMSFDDGLYGTIPDDPTPFTLGTPPPPPPRR